jgi:hypothetical protein
MTMSKQQLHVLLHASGLTSEPTTARLPYAGLGNVHVICTVFLFRDTPDRQETCPQSSVDQSDTTE